MRELRRFWRSLETLPGGAAVGEQWKRLLGEEYDLARTFFRPAGERVLAFPHRDPDLGYYRVVSHGPDDHVGVCDETGERITLSAADLVVEELDHIAIYRALGFALGLTGEPTPVDHLPHTYRLGHYAPLAGYRFPAWLTIQFCDVEFDRVIDRFVAFDDSPFLMLAPTGRFLFPRGEACLRRRQACFLPLEEAIVLGDDGRLVATAMAEQAMDAFRRRVVPEDTATVGISFFPTPAGATWSQVRLHLTDGHTVSVTVGAAHGVFNSAQLGMVNRKSGNPSVQWELLRVFAQGGGVLTWRSPGAERRNQKRRELLARCLARFFRIEGDPFQACGNGWRTRFQISGPD